MHGGDIVDAHDRRAAVDTVADRGERAGVAPARPPQRQGTDEVLARDRQQDRPAELDDGVEVAQHLDRLSGCLGEVRARVEHDAVDVDTHVDHLRHALPQERDDVGDDVVVVGELLALRRRPGVHHHDPGTALGTRDGQIDVAQATHVVDEVGALGEHGAGHLRLPRVDRHDHVESDEPGDEGRDTADLLVGVERVDAGDPRFTPDVDDRGSGGGELLGARDLLSTPAYSPPSENDSGLALTIPMISGSPTGATRVRSRSRSIGGERNDARRVSRLLAALPLYR